MAETVPTVSCSGCGTQLNEGANLSMAEREPCPNCGSRTRTVAIALTGIVNIYSKCKTKGRRAAEKRPFVEQVVGDDLHRASGRWMRLNRLLDRARNWYSETVIDPESGTVIHKCEEPLTDHQGHGGRGHSVAPMPRLPPILARCGFLGALVTWETPDSTAARFRRGDWAGYFEGELRIMLPKQ